MINDGSIWLLKLIVPLSVGAMVKAAQYRWRGTEAALSEVTPPTQGPASSTDSSGSTTSPNIFESTSSIGPSNGGASGGSTRGSAGAVYTIFPSGPKTKSLSNGGATCRATCRICDVNEAPMVDSMSPALVELKQSFTKEKEEFLRLAILSNHP